MYFDSFTVKESPDNRTTRPHILPIYATSSFAFEDIDQGIEIFKNIESGHGYSRYANPTVDVVAQKIADLEAHGLDIEAHAIMTSSGMSAISTLFLGVLKAGDKVQQGEEFGFIKFGSRVDLFLPLGTQLDVKIGDVVKGSQSVIGKL